MARSGTPGVLIGLAAAAVLIKGCGGGCEIFESWPSVPAPEGVWVVRAEAPEGGDGRNWRTAFRHPQDAVDIAQAGEEVWVAGRMYTRRVPEDTVVLTMKDGVSLYGGFRGTESAREERDWSANVTTLDGDADGDGEGDVYHVVVGASGAVFDGFSVTRGNAAGDPSESSTWGAGMWSSSVDFLTVTHCLFSHNRAQFGGGMAIENGMFVMVSHCVFDGNSASSFGGGMCNIRCSRVEIVECILRGNSADTGGGAIANALNGGSYVTNCTFLSNTAGTEGGGLHNLKGRSYLAGCLFVGNLAQEGGAVWNGAYNDVLFLTNSTLVGNSAEYGGAAYNAGDSFNPSYFQMIGCILWDDRAYTGGQEISLEYWPVDITHSCIAQDGYAGANGNINADPLFVDPGRWDDAGTPGDPADDFFVEGDYRLQPGSPCIDAGDNSMVPQDSADLDADGDTTEPVPFDLAGEPRFIDDPATPDTGVGPPPIVDMGAYEFQP